MDRYDYLRKITDSTCALNDFSVSDETYFTGNGRQVRVRPPADDERPALRRTLELFGYQSFALVLRTGEKIKPAALIALQPDAAGMLAASLARMGTDEMLALVLRQDAHVFFLEE
jgi:hypothetical protein